MIIIKNIKRSTLEKICSRIINEVDEVNRVV
ncbi:hypothetical protein IC218_15650 [Clostridioides sp. ES-S-0005-03]|nr:hypothetical protein [Clostridioides sp. ES-S-0145-01]MCC0681706.1 hypothetical protein [Clostridioides sp. ES-S-0005-03]UDN49331.1 hypothetical protein JJJ25_01645 [Clostridioides sp. ES-S-0173-01]